MTPQELKASILQLAIQGKLVPQIPEEGTGEELFQEIQAEKQRLIKTGKIKKEKSLPEITEDEIQFDIPENWRHVRLGEVFCLEMGQSPDGNTVSEIGNGIEFHQGKVHFGKMELQLSPQKTTAPTKYAEPDSVLLCVRAPVGKVNITKRQICIGRGLCAVKPICGVSVEFVYYWLATMENTFVKKATGTTFVAITGDVVKNQVIPLPPLAEQKRIVAKIEELLPYIDRYEQAWSKLEDFNKRFPVDMQKSILQMAIQGKLVEQRPEEGTGEELYQQILTHKKRILGGKKEGKLSSDHIKEDELPFEIPETWKWVRFGHIMINRDAERVPLSVDERAKLEKKYDYYGASGVIDKVDRYLFDKKLLLIGEDGANLLSRSTPIAFLAQGQYWVNNHAHVLDCNEDMLCMEYIMWFINATNLAPYVTGTAQPKMNQQKMNSIPIALPPLAEQKRIVAKLEEILPLCERLK